MYSPYACSYGDTDEDEEEDEHDYDVDHNPRTECLATRLRPES